MSTATGYKCPHCGAPVSFDSGSQKIRCGYCGSEFAAEELDSLKGKDGCITDEMDNCGSEWSAEEAASMVVYNCDSCGGAVITDRTTAAARCPYCNSPVVMASHFAGGLRPDYILPFKLDKEAAKAGLRQHFKGKFLLPSQFKNEHHIDEIKGVYVPYWIYDADISARFTFHGVKIPGKRKSEKVSVEVFVPGSNEEKHFSIVRGGTISFRGLPVDGSTKLDDAVAESLEPYDLSAMTAFHPAYLSGYFADRYDVDREECRKRANRRIRDTIEKQLKETIENPSHYWELRAAKEEIKAVNASAKYVLYPVWLLSTTWGGRQFLYAMNGQTGKFVGNLPVNKKKFMLCAALIGAGAALLVMLLIYFLS